MVNQDEDANNYLLSWKGRLRATLLEYIILHESAYSTSSVYPYSIWDKLKNDWGDLTPPLPTIYSVIKRLESQKFIDVNSEIEGGRVQKKIIIRESGFDLLDRMKNEFETLNDYLKRYANELESK